MTRSPIIMVLVIFMAFVILLIVGMQEAKAQDHSTWGYGSPADVRRAGLQSVQYGGHHGYHYSGPNPTSVWMDIVFRAASPELYRYTQRPAPQINIYNAPSAQGNTVYSNNEPTGVVDYNLRRDKGAITHRTPRYPSALVP